MGDKVIVDKKGRVLRRVGKKIGFEYNEDKVIQRKEDNFKEFKKEEVDKC